jgi:hypothetical protein
MIDTTAVPALPGVLAGASLDPVDSAQVPPRPAASRPVPDGLAERVRDVLARRFPQGLYAHQARGIELALEGRDLCLATSTASGKSLVFMAYACHSHGPEPRLPAPDRAAAAPARGGGLRRRG